MELLQRVVLGDVMSIVRVTVRTFQNAEHATLFTGISANIPDLLKKHGLMADCRIARSQEKPHEIISIWVYEDEAHMEAVRKVLTVPQSTFRKIVLRITSCFLFASQRR